MTKKTLIITALIISLSLILGVSARSTSNRLYKYHSYFQQRVTENKSLRRFNPSKRRTYAQYQFKNPINKSRRTPQYSSYIRPRTINNTNPRQKLLTRASTYKQYPRKMKPTTKINRTLEKIKAVPLKEITLHDVNFKNIILFDEKIKFNIPKGFELKNIKKNKKTIAIFNDEKKSINLEITKETGMCDNILDLEQCFIQYANKSIPRNTAYSNRDFQNFTNEITSSFAEENYIFSYVFKSHDSLHTKVIHFILTKDKDIYIFDFSSPQKYSDFTYSISKRIVRHFNKVIGDELWNQ